MSLQGCARCDKFFGQYKQRGNPNGPLFCYKCIEIVNASSGQESGGCSPRYSDSRETRELYHRLTTAPNSEYPR